MANIFKSWMKILHLIQISQKFVQEGPIDNMWALVQVMAWCQTGDKPLFEPIAATGPKWHIIEDLGPRIGYLRQE